MPKFTLIPQPLLPNREKGGQDPQSPSPRLGEGFRVRESSNDA
jgi:hypothetical protein